MPIVLPKNNVMTREQVIAKLYEIQKARGEIRRQEQTLKSKRNLLEGQPLISKDDLASSLQKIIPRYLEPRNIGQIDSVMWDFFFPLTVDFGTDPTYDETTRQTVTTQVSQESAFLLVGISRAYENNGDAGFGAPLQVTIRDNQSTRQFNDNPIPLQTIGLKGQPTAFDTPLLLQPNSRISLEVSSWLDGDQLVTVGSGKHEFVLYGMRVRDVNNAKVMSAVWL
jgi:hypothetical protein